jgi:hypothetical protein
MGMNIGSVDELNVFEILFCQNGEISRRGLMTQTIDNCCLFREET